MLTDSAVSLSVSFSSHQCVAHCSRMTTEVAANGYLLDTRNQRWRCNENFDIYILSHENKNLTELHFSVIYEFDCYQSFVNFMFVRTKLIFVSEKGNVKNDDGTCIVRLYNVILSNNRKTKVVRNENLRKKK